MSTNLIPLLSVAVALAGLILGMFYWQDRRIERLDSRHNRRFDELTQQIRELEERQNQQIRELEERQNRQIRELEARQNLRFDEAFQQIRELEARQNLRFDEIIQQIKELSDRTGNLERGQSRLEGQLDIIRDALFQRNPSQAD